MSKKTGTPAYLEALKHLTHIINTEYAEGGKFPGSLEMCKRLNVCMVTYIKILKILCREGILVASKGRGGTHVRPRKERLTKIGIVFRNAEDSPFIGNSSSMLSAFNLLNDEHFMIHLIQSSKLENVYDKAIFHGVCGLIWLFPEIKTIPTIQAIQEKTDMPILLMGIDHREIHAICQQKNLNSVFPDPVVEAELIMNFAVRNGYRSILRIDRYIEAVAKNWFAAAKKFGVRFDQDHYLASDHIAAEFLLKRKETGATLVLSEGGYSVYSRLFTEIEKLPESERPAVLVRQSGNLPHNVTSLHPGIKLLGTMEEDHVRMGEIGARMMMDHIRSGTPLAMTPLAISSISLFEK